MRLAFLAVLLAGATAWADDVDITARVLVVGDPEHQITPEVVFKSIDAKSIDACPLPRTAVYVWLVFEKGKVVSADAGGTTDRPVEQCLAKAVKSATLTGKGRIVALLEMSTQLTGKTPAIAALPPTPPPQSYLPVIGGGTGSGTAAAIPNTGIGTGSAAPEDTSALTADSINKVVVQNAKALRGCYDIARRTVPELAGKFTYRFDIDRSGAVTGAKADGVQPPDKLDMCVVRVIKSMKFPAAGGPSIVRYPFVFTTN